MAYISTGEELTTFITGLNADASVDPTLLGVLIQSAQTILDEERPWVVLRKIDTSKSVSVGNSWQTAIDLSSITDFSRFYVNEDAVTIRLFDGDNRIERYVLKPWDQRIEWKDVGGTCVYDENSKNLYLNGEVPFSGTLHIPYISYSSAVDPTSDQAVWSPFPSRFLPILGFYAVGVYKGGVDYDSINRQMLPTNSAVLLALKNAMEKWDNEKQLAFVYSTDPSEYPGGYPRDRAIERDI